MLASRFTGDCAERLNQFDRAVRKVYRFRDEIQELIRTPELMLDDWINRGYLEGDCDDISTFSACVVKAMGLSCRFVCIRTDPNDSNFKHVFVEVFCSGLWGRLDFTVSNQTEMTYFGKAMLQNV